MNRLSKPRDGPEWLRWAEATLARLDARRPVEVPIGGMVLWPVAAIPEGYWLDADGSTLTADDWPLLEEVLGGLTLPNPATVSGHGWLIRAG